MQLLVVEGDGGVNREWNCRKGKMSKGCRPNPVEKGERCVIDDAENAGHSREQR